MGIRSNSTAEAKHRNLHAGFLILTHTRSLYYGITVSFKQMRIRQYANLYHSGGIEIYDRVTEAMSSPENSPEMTVLRIRIDEDHFTALLNDQPLTHFPYQHDFQEINMIELSSDGEVEVVQLEERKVPVGLFPNTGDVCRNREWQADCEYWRKLGYCGGVSSSRYQEF